MQLLKKSLKKVAAVGIGAAMLGMTMSGALAATYTLGDYPTPFSGKGTVLVVGATADASDSAAMEDVAFGLDSLKTTTTTTVGALTFEDGELEDVDLASDGKLSSAFSGGLDENDDVGLVEGELSLTHGTDAEYDFHEEIAFTSGARFATALEASEIDEDFKDQVVLKLDSGSMSYNFVLDEDLDPGNEFSNLSEDDDDEIEMQFLGKDLDIKGASEDSITAVIGDKVSLMAGESVKVGTHTIKFMRAGAENALIEIDGESFTKDVGKILDKKGVEVYVDAVFDEEDPSKEYGVFVIGEEAQKTFSDGNAYWDEDETDRLWDWNIAALDDTNRSAITLGVELAEDLNDPTEALDSEIVDLGLTNGDKMYLAVGDYLCLPHQYACVIFDSISGDMEPKDVTFKIANKDLFSANGTTEMMSDEDVLLITSSTGGNKGIDYVTDETNSVAIAFNETLYDAQVFVYDKDEGDYVYLTGSDITNGSDAFANPFSIENDDYSARVWFNTTTTALSVIVELASGNLTFNSTYSGNEIKFLGALEDEDTANIYYFNGTAIDGIEENVRTADGVLIYDPEANIDNDEVKIALPNDNEFKVNVRVAMPTGSSTSTSTTTAYTKMKDTEVLDTLTSYNVVTVGGPAVNKVTAKLMGKEFPAVAANSGIAEGKALLELLPNGAKWALVVAGWEKENTLAAASLLKNYADNTAKFKGKSTVVVSGTTAIGVTFE